MIELVRNDEIKAIVGVQIINFYKIKIDSRCVSYYVTDRR